MAAVGGAPGSGTSSISVQAGAFSKAARAVVEGGAVGSTSLNDLASLARDQSGGVYVRGLEGLVGAGLGMGYIDHGTLGAQGDANVRRVMEGLEAVGVRGASERRSLFSLEEAEAAMHSARREQEVLERKLGALVKRNRKVALGNVR
jgi:CCR4-NOT transcription complex subunit 4